MIREINFATIISTIINIALLAGIIILLYRAIKGVNNFINRNEQLDKKLNIILNKLDVKNNN